MGKISTQPSLSHPVHLRSGFYALPFVLASFETVHLFVRLHNSASTSSGSSDEEQQNAGSSSSKQLFVTGLPLGTSEKGLKAALGRVWACGTSATEAQGEGKTAFRVKNIQLLPYTTGQASYTLESQQLALASSSSSSDISPLFDLEALSACSLSSPTNSPAQSAIVTFTSPPPFPPPPYPPATLNLPPPTSFLALSAGRHAAARPHKSLVTAHVDSWMAAFDQRKKAELPEGYNPATVAAAAMAEAGGKKKTKKNKKASGKEQDVGPLPGSAAEALARHAALQAKYQDKAFNPDEMVEEEWQTVNKGGRHGKSLLPTGVTPGVGGYGGVNVKVAKAVKGSELGEKEREAGVRKIVGDGFYRFNRAEGRRKELTALKSRFEEDKRRVDHLCSGGGGGRGRGGFARGGGGEGRGRGGRGRGGGGGREGRAFKPY